MKLKKEPDSPDENTNSAVSPPPAPQQATPPPVASAAEPAQTAQTAAPASEPKMQTPPATPAATAPAASAEGEEGAKEEEDAAENIPSRAQILRKKAAAFVVRFAQNRKVWISTAVLAGVFVVYQLGVLIYGQTLLTLADNAMRERNYTEAIARVEKHEELNGRTAESLLILARAEMYLGDYVTLGQMLSTYEGEDPEMQYMQIVSRNIEDPNAAARLLAGLAFQHGESHPYIDAARGIFLMLDGAWGAAQQPISQVRTVQDDFFANEHLLELHRLFLRWTDLKFSREVPVYFSFPQGGDDRGLGFVPGVEAFFNIYQVPLSEHFLANNVAAEDVDSIYRGLRILTETQANQENAMTIATAHPTGSSLLADYLAGFYLVQEGKYAEAAERYKSISDRDENTLSTQYEAQALWLASEGAPPDDRIKELLNRAVALGIDPNPFNLSALNNIAYLEYVYGDLKNAVGLINHGLQVDTTNKFIALNHLLIEIADGTVEYGRARAQVEGLLPEFPQSETLLHIAVKVETELGNIQQSINYLYLLRERRPEDPAVILQIAERYRYLGNIFSAIQDLAAAREQFPDNLQIGGELALYQAIHGDPGVEETIAGLPASLVAAGHARAVVMAQRGEYEQAAQVAQTALDNADASQRAGIALNLARMELGAGALDRAKKAADAARNVMEHSPLLGLERALNAVSLRVQAEQNAPVFDEAEKALQEAEAHKDVFAQLDIARALIALDQAEPGVQALERIRREQHGNIRTPDFFTALIEGYEALGQKENAGRARARVAAILAGDDEEEETESTERSASRVFAGRAETLKAINAAIKARDYAEAVELFTQIIDNKDARVAKPALNFQNRGVLNVKLKRYEEAAADFAKALSMREQLSTKEVDTVHYNYVHVLGNIGEYNKLESEVETRIAAAEKAGEDFAHRRAYLQLLGRGLVNRGDHKKAADVYGRLVELYPRDVSNYILLSDSERLLENFEDAVAALSEGLEIDPQNIKIHERLLQIYRQLGNSDLARQELKIINDLRRQ